MTKPFDLDAPLTTRDRCEVRIYARDGGGQFPIHGAIKRDNYWPPCTWTAEGRCVADPDFQHQSDLINTPVKREGWVNFTAGQIAGRVMVQGCYPSQESARVAADSRTVACIHVSFTEGEGL